MKFNPELVFSEHDPRKGMHMLCSRRVPNHFIKI